MFLYVLEFAIGLNCEKRKLGTGCYSISFSGRIRGIFKGYRRSVLVILRQKGQIRQGIVPCQILTDTASDLLLTLKIKLEEMYSILSFGAREM